MNVVNKESQSHSHLIDKDDYESLVSAIPRDDGGLYSQLKPKKSAWSIKDSFFEEYKKDHPELENECFEFDW